jgi:Ca2+-binding RTX toxin-like protein
MARPGDSAGTAAHLSRSCSPARPPPHHPGVVSPQDRAGGTGRQPEQPPGDLNVLRESESGVTAVNTTRSSHFISLKSRARSGPLKFGGGIMAVESGPGVAVGLSGPKTVRRVLLVVSLTIATGVALLLPTPTANAERFVGTDRRDDIFGTAQADRILARGGDDNVFAGAGADIVRGGSGNDSIRLGSPDAAVWERMESANGGSGSDTIFGTGARDRMNGGGASDLVLGGSAADQLIDGAGPDDLGGGAGRDLIRLKGGGRDRAQGGPQGDFFIVFPDGSPDRIQCGSGRDTVEFRFRREAIDQTTDCETQRVGATQRKLVPRNEEGGS